MKTNSTSQKFGVAAILIFFVLGIFSGIGIELRFKENSKIRPILTEDQSQISTVGRRIGTLSKLFLSQEVSAVDGHDAYFSFQTKDTLVEFIGHVDKSITITIHKDSIGRQISTMKYWSFNRIRPDSFGPIFE